MTPDELISALAPSRLPPAMLRLGLPEALALFGLGLLVGLGVALLLRPFLRRRPSVRARIRATRDMSGEERLLALARILGRLPKALRPAAYGAAPVPPEREIERLARGRE